MYFETGWEPLYVRRKHTRLKTIRKVNHNLAPDYMLDIFPSIRSHTSNYVTRNSQDYSIPKCRLQIYENSFVPTAIQEWNALTVETRQSETLSKFMNSISNTTKLPPLYFSFGDRRLNIIHTRIRHHCILNKDLFRCNIIDSPLCTCGSVEDEYHYFFSCNKYRNARHELFDKIFMINKLHIVNTHVLLWGDSALSNKENEYLFSLIHTFIKHSNRFN